MYSKIYCVLCDGMPLSQELRDFATKRNLNVVRQVGNCTTDGSMTRMFTGKLPSDYLDQGFGYHTNRLECFRDPESKKILVPWYSETVLSWLQGQGWIVHLHNIVPDSWYRGDSLTDSYPGGYETRYTKVLDFNDRFFARTMMNPIHLNDAPGWKEREFQFIKSLSQMSKHTFCFIEYLHLHSYGFYAEKHGENERLRKRLTQNILTLLETFNTNEPDVLFWFFSDHGPQRAFIGAPPLESYLSWIITNANLPSIIAIEAFTEMIKGLKIQRNKDAVYYVEDGRKEVDPYNYTTASACMVTKWDENMPKEIVQAGYFKPQRNYIYRKTNLDSNLSESLNSHNSEYWNTLRTLRNCIQERFQWVK